MGVDIATFNAFIMSMLKYLYNAGRRVGEEGR